MKMHLTMFLLASATAVEVSENPIRRVVNLLQAQQVKVEKQGEKQEDMFDKFVCYCKTNSEKLQKNVDDLTAAIPQHEASVKSSTELKAQVEEELKTHKQDREDAQATIDTSTKQRNKEQEAFEAASTESKANIAAMKKAIAALRKGLGEAFLQSSDVNLLQRAVASAKGLSDFDSQQVTSFLEGKSQMQGSGEIVGILEQMAEQMAADLKESEEGEVASVQDFEALTAAKNKENGAATTAIEDKTGRVGKLAVDIVNSKNDLADAQDAFEEDSNFLLELKKSCAEQTTLFDEVKKMRAQEIAAIGSTIKILNDDDALDLFKQTMPSPGQSFLQVRAHTSSRARARELIKQAGTAASRTLGSASASAIQAQFLQLALRGKKAGFEKVIQMMDDFVALLKKEQEDDETQKKYCEGEFDRTEDESKELNRNIKTLGTEIAEGEEAIAGLKDSIAALQQGIVDLDKSVAEATETRKEESAEYSQAKAQNNAALALLDAAKNQLNKFYNPKMYKAPQRRELTEEERIYVSSGGEDPRDAEEAAASANSIAGTGVNVFVQLHARRGAPPPPPMTIKAYKKSDSSGPVALMDRLMTDMKLEMQEDDMEEKQAQKDYEGLTKQSAEKRATDSKTIVEQESQQAEAETRLGKAHKSKKAAGKELMALGEFIGSLHADCDFLVQNFDLRREARDNEIGSIQKAKAVLSGADYDALMQLSVHTVRTPASGAFLQKEEQQCVDDKHRVALFQSLKVLMMDANQACVDMCKNLGSYPHCDCPDYEADLTPGVTTWDELYAIFDQLKDSGREMLKKYSKAA